MKDFKWYVSPSHKQKQILKVNIQLSLFSYSTYYILATFNL